MPASGCGDKREGIVPYRKRCASTHLRSRSACILRNRGYAQGHFERRCDTPPDHAWVDLSDAKVEISSEDSAYPIEGALVGLQGRGWRASVPGKQTIRITFDRPRHISRLGIEFEEDEVERSQEFAISWCTAPGAPWREAVRQQWNFSPGGSTVEAEEYAVNLDGVARLQLEIDPDRGRNTALASLKRLHVDS